MSVVDIVPGDGESDSHLRQGLEDGPDAATDESIGDDHVSRPAGGQGLAGCDEDTTANIGAQGDDLESTWCEHVRAAPGRSQIQSYVDLARGDGTVKLAVPVIRVYLALGNTAGRLQTRADLLNITELLVLAGQH